MCVQGLISTVKGIRPQLILYSVFLFTHRISNRDIEVVKNKNGAKNLIIFLIEREEENTLITIRLIANEVYMKLEAELYKLVCEFYESEENVKKYKKMSGCTSQDNNHPNKQNAVQDYTTRRLSHNT